MLQAFNHTSGRLVEASPNNPQISNNGRDGLVDSRISSSPAARLKRQSSNPYSYIGSNYIKRRSARPECTVKNSEFLDNLIFEDGVNETETEDSMKNHIATPKTPSKFDMSRRQSFVKKAWDDPQVPMSYITGAPQSPYSFSQLKNSRGLSDNNGNSNRSSRQFQPLSGMGTRKLNEESIESIRRDGNGNKSVGTGNGNMNNNTTETLDNNDSGESRDATMNDSLQNNHNSLNGEGNINDSNAYTNTGGNTHGNGLNDGNGNRSNDNSNDNNHGNGNGNGNDNSGNSIPSSGVPVKKSSQTLVQKLQDIYKIIVKQEIELQERCSQLTTSQTTELKNLWTIYRINSDLINNYVTFITTALLPSQSEQDLAIGQEIVEIYRIERRLWVYGTITFLDVLKNFSNFMDPEVCCQFITHVFISISNMLSDIPSKYAIPWLQRLGDLSRMAIALYPSGFIDWKLSAEHWYMEAMKFSYSHGKLYYHMSTVQQNTLEAFVNLGKSVFCQDTFIPSQQYMQLVIDNIYQRAFVERNGGNHRNTQIIEYLKHSEVMLLPSFAESLDLQQVVLVYFRDKFGIDSTDNNIFCTKNMFQQNSDQLKYFFRHAPVFSESHILQLVGFGEPKNPFALLFGLPKYLKERKDKKEKRKTKAPSSIETSSSMAIDDEDPDPSLWDSSPNEFFENIDSLKYQNLFPSSIEIWNESLNYINMTSLKCGMLVLQKFLQGPMVIALPHLLPWTYFVISVFLKIEEIQDEYSRQFWIDFMNRIFPWNTIVNFLNMLLAFMLDSNYQTSIINRLCSQYSRMSLDDLLDYFNNNEELPEVWKCWGTLWFDVIHSKGQTEVDGYESVGIKDYKFLDTPIDGIGFDENDESGENFWKRSCRVIFLFKEFAQRFDSRLSLSFTAPVSSRRESLPCDNVIKSFSFKLNKESSLNSDDSLSSALRNAVNIFEVADAVNTDYSATPMLSVAKNESFFEYTGYKKLYPTFSSYDKSGEFISGSFYTSVLNDSSVKVNSQKVSSTSATNINCDTNNSEVPEGVSVLNEEHLFNECMDPTTNKFYSRDEFRVVDPSCEMNQKETYFVLDATSWLRHFGHVYKLATREALKFAICLTTFQELRFLRKSKDENVVEAATRAIITVRQLYNEQRILPLRFTGNVATHIEEHLEFEEQITWRSHVDEFVIEAVIKAQDKFKEMKVREGCKTENSQSLKHVVLVTDDASMRKKALNQGIATFTTRFVFSVCNAIGWKK
ncbi:hypothetical protein HG535_0F06060 [Zygotorulaspora mrakii]|uniref:PIN domain-containing protein n=1 Tax=Zygotorulaspora mrakii TaxID=42260 RepID=A0A7H9B6Z7_ZYGMR|nr:uncharacterized protein HG535_0F06060 [Zygotorulaspora mrakii]QLG74094.1 hypothetical protein HG535_0F06060 [Zygotorulaspora mrakii]